MTTTHDDELEEILSTYFVEYKAARLPAEMDTAVNKATVALKARELAARRESAQRLQQKITRYGDGVIAYHNGEATVPISAVLEELVGLKSQQQENEDA